MIRKSGGTYKVTSKAGRTLGTHASESKAKKQLAAIEIAKHKRKR